jgi:para-aminobenzoate synthetase / 4-amino-4-deoxychorismate lyase
MFRNYFPNKSFPVVIIRDNTNEKWLIFSKPLKIFVTHEIREVMPILQEIGKKVEKDGKYAAGFISYEAASAFDLALKTKQGGEIPLLWFGVFDKVQEMTLPATSQDSFIPELDWYPSIIPEEYRRCFERIKEYIRDGDTYQVNYTYRLRAPFSGDPYQFFLQIVSGNEPPYAAYIDSGDWAICSVSPELFFRLDGENIESQPMKGTAGRGLWFEQDVQQGEWLHVSEKDRAENLMIVDMVRNDLGRIADTGTVNVSSLFDVNRYPTVWQMTSTVRAKTQVPLDEIFKALFPPASITGAPKARTMEIINELESSPRRIYTGTIGYAVPGRKMQFNVAIRTILIDKNRKNAEYGVGGGIVWDSQLESEKNECHIKTHALRKPVQDFDLLETMLWTPKDGYFLLPYHLKRLMQSAEYFDFTVDLRYVESELAKWAEKLSKTSHRIRLLVSKKGAVAIESNPFEILKADFPDIALAASPIDSSNPFLFHKTTNRQIYQDAINSVSSLQDVLLYNQKGEITESTIANIAVEFDGILYTPPIRCGLLQGTYREWMLEQKKIIEKVVKIDDISSASNVFLMNALRGMHKVRVINSQSKATTFKHI